ncbi:uncharacterized protein LOC126484667 [Schistocerca serialis cubense]|uniref:uncharacterized protein LOC126484667 n=1 Tax=Schistocerca serialis cubense TaxID=2023355 RepID=UPI00214E2BB2|nr:uncharacterized protein LOC126484667 [Schistocerca serialis cubense]
MYPQFETDSENTQLYMARFSSVKKLHDIECTQIVKFANKLNLKSLFPSNLERQNVKLVLNVFNEMTVQGLLALGEHHHIESFESTAKFIKLICTWWNIVNVSSPGKDIRFKDAMLKPLSSTSNENIRYLERFLSWLDKWKHISDSTFGLSSDTHLAISHTTHALLEQTKYCTEELNFKYLLPGKVQTDALEARFGKYRTMAGSQYLVSLRQVFEIESKLRIQTLLSLKISSSALGEVGIDLDSFESDCVDDITLPPPSNFQSIMDFSEEQVQSVQEYVPVFTYLSGYCARAVLKKLRCETCKIYLVLDKTLSIIESYESYGLLRNVDRGGLYCPNNEVINAVIFTYLIVKNLMSEEHELSFMRCTSQRNLVVRLAVDVIKREDFFLREFSCSQVDHTDDKILQSVVKVACNIFLNNYVKRINDGHIVSKMKKRKLSTVK